MLKRYFNPVCLHVGPEETLRKTQYWSRAIFFGGAEKPWWCHGCVRKMTGPAEEKGKFHTPFCAMGELGEDSTTKSCIIFIPINGFVQLSCPEVGAGPTWKKNMSNRI